MPIAPRLRMHVGNIYELPGLQHRQLRWLRYALSVVCFALTVAATAMVLAATVARGAK